MRLAVRIVSVVREWRAERVDEAHTEKGVAESKNEQWAVGSANNVASAGSRQAQRGRARRQCPPRPAQQATATSWPNAIPRVAIRCGARVGGRIALHGADNAPGVIAEGCRVQPSGFGSAGSRR